jgi:alginate O-acetyltransferase complex protein AlgI
VLGSCPKSLYEVVSKKSLRQMLFNSIDFALFFPIVFILYWFVANKNLSAQNLLLLVASFVFYGWWDTRFLLLLMFSTLLGYFTAIWIHDARSRRWKVFWFWISIVANVGFLGVFKYFNFFAESFQSMLQAFGIKSDLWTLEIILPIGISFYTFHGLSYVIDVYKGQIKPERKVVEYGVFVSFFPLLVAGPIERATHLLPQIQRRREFSYSSAVDGMRQILWGLFKKVVVADGAAEYANLIFNNSDDYSGTTLLMGAVFFSFQIYCDFSGYSDIALGTARLFGIELIRNFAFPYFSRDIAEFWRRWHISLSSWFRDYLYIPLGGSKGGAWMRVRNTFAIFIVSGFWHGANWTFIVWGALNAIYFLPLLLTKRNRVNLETVAQGRHLPSIRELYAMVSTFGLVMLGWIFFRANDLGHALAYVRGIFTRDLFSSPQLPASSTVTLCFMFFMLVVEWFGRERKHALENFGVRQPAFMRWAFYGFLTACVIVFSGKEQEFIYFQF